MEISLILCAVVITVCILTNKITNKFGIPAVLVFMAIGMIFGSEGIFKIPFSNFTAAEKICSTALVFIMFYGGCGTNFKSAKPILPQAACLATFGVILTAGLTGVFCHFVLKMSLQESLLLGAVVASTDAASVFSILRSKKLNLKDGTASILEVEGTDTILIIALVLFSYAGPVLLGGNGYLSVYLFGIIIGNQKFENKIKMVHFFDGINHLAQILIFFLLGLLVFPSGLVHIVGISALVFIGLTFVARPISTALILSPFRTSWQQQLLIAFSGLRGAASIVFAIMATVSPVYTKSDIFNIVFCVSLISVAFQGMLLPVVANKLDMIDEGQDVMKTFSDYQEEQQIQLIQMTMKKGHKYIGKKISELHIRNMLIVLIKRGAEDIVPRTNTMIQEGDILVRNTHSY